VSRGSARRRRLSRRGVLVGLGGGLAALAGVRLALPRWLAARPLLRVEELSPEARALVDAAFADVDRARVWDVHAHLVGLGTGGSGCSIGAGWTSHLHPVRRLQYELYLAAAGVRDGAQADAQYLARLLALHRAANPLGKLCLLAFDRRVDASGAEHPEDSTIHTPDAYVLDVAAREPDVVPVVSVHPYRKDALARLEQARERGAPAVKWLPNSMGMDPADPACEPFYRRMAELGMVLISHAGVERAVHAPEDQELGNPLRLRRALDAGVRVVVAHCAGLGTSQDLDRGGTARSFDLFLRLMEEPAWAGRLFGDVSAVTLVNRATDALRELLAAPELHPRLVDGSDYPLIAIDPLVSVRLLVHRGFVDGTERAALDEVFEANPLLFDFVLKRRLRIETPAGTRRFDRRVFETARLFG